MGWAIGLVSPNFWSAHRASVQNARQAKKAVTAASNRGAKRGWCHHWGAEVCGDSGCEKAGVSQASCRRNVGQVALERYFQRHALRTAALDVQTSRSHLRHAVINPRRHAWYERFWLWSAIRFYV